MVNEHLLDPGITIMSKTHDIPKGYDITGKKMLILDSHKGEIILKERIIINVTMRFYNKRI